MKTGSLSAPPLLPKVLLGALLLSATAPLMARPQTTTLQRGEVRLLQGDDGYAIEQASGRLALPLSNAVEAHALVGSGERWFLTAVNGVELVVLAGSPKSIETLASPPPSHGSLRSEPEPLANARGLQAMAWLEGDEPYRLAVKAARWTGGGWSTAETIAPMGPGSQLALTSAALDHGGFILAWSAFDGQDDEIWWSRFDGLTWTPPARVAVDNRVPDITPELRTTADGAVLAWSRYDGNDYRVTTAVFDGEAWSEPRQIGPPGSSFPAFIDRPGAPLLLSRRAAPHGWLVLELDAAGQILRQAEITTSGPERPTLIDLTSEGSVITWPGDQPGD